MRFIDAWRKLKAIPGNLGLRILALIQRVSVHWHAGGFGKYQATIAMLEEEIKQYREREKKIWDQVEYYQHKEDMANVKLVSSKGPYKSGMKPATSPDFENYIQNLSREELKKMDQELTETITNAPAVIHND